MIKADFDKLIKDDRILYRTYSELQRRLVETLGEVVKTGDSVISIKWRIGKTYTVAHYDKATFPFKNLGYAETAMSKNNPNITFKRMPAE